MNTKSFFLLLLGIHSSLSSGRNSMGVTFGEALVPRVAFVSSSSSSASTSYINYSKNSSYCKQSTRTTNTASTLLFINNNKIIDVSELNLTMEDLQKPLPQSILSTIERSGYQSTSRISTIDDNGCYWIENNNIMNDDDDDGSFGIMDVTLSIPGLRGQPPEAISVLFSTSTISVTVFGRVVWSCIQRGYSIPDECAFMVHEGKDMVPMIQLSVQKEKVDDVWGGFILQVGEDSIL